MLQKLNKQNSNTSTPSAAQSDNAKVQELMTEEELIVFLRIPHISKAKDYHNVIENLKRGHNFPWIHICKQPLYPLEVIRKWVEGKMLREQR